MYQNCILFTPQLVSRPHVLKVVTDLSCTSIFLVNNSQFNLLSEFYLLKLINGI